MTMEKSKSNQQVKTKCSNFKRFLIPTKIPNKVGVTSKELGSINVYTRPLSLNSCNIHTLSNDNLLKINNQNGELRRCSSVSEADLQSNTHNSLANNFEENSNSSADNLAKRALIAAHVLHLIPAQKARQRNYLQGRVGANSILGPAELDKTFPTRNVTIFIGTWNMNGHSPPLELNDFVLPTGLEHIPDILVFGTQESCSERFEWEAGLQETLGPTHVLFHSTSLGTLHLVIFLRRDLIWYCSIAEDASLSVRPGTAFKTKGAIASAFTLFGSSFLFVTAHLTAHQEKVKERVADVRKIVHALDLPRNIPCKNKSKDATQNFDYVFWCGDLNFRLATPRDKVLEWLSKTSFPLPAHMPHGYLHHDQLCSVLADGAAFRGFQEANITFPPTYKYDVGTQNFDTSAKQRTPGYTDRILYKQRTIRRVSQIEAPQLECLIYDSVPSIITSDHKPVWGIFKAHLRPGIDTIPLAAGLFNRDVYLEGIRRRATSLNSQRNETTICSIQ